jgi:DNA-directed RNA polymerase specialized sigma24 family protein
VQDYFRNRGAGKRGGGLEDVALDERIAAGAHAPEAIERNVLVAEIRERLQGFSVRDRAIFWMHFRHGMTARAISEIRALELTQKGVESALTRITRQLREDLTASAPAHSAKEKM